MLGDEVFQRGSNINSERLSFDFSFNRKVIDEELAQVEDIVNLAIAEKVDVVCEEMTIAEANEKGVIGVFNDKYGDIVKIYTIGTYSTEIYSGPHADNTADLCSFKIIKEESVATGVRFIKATIMKKNVAVHQ